MATPNRSQRVTAGAKAEAMTILEFSLLQPIMDPRLGTISKMSNSKEETYKP